MRDFRASFDFYVEDLGFSVYLEHEGASPEAGPNILGLPHNLTAKIPRKVAILSPHGPNLGSVELLSFEGATGADFSATAVPPNRGILMLRFPVADMDALLHRFQDRGIQPVAGPASLELQPYGRLRAVAVRAPEGAWLEFLELASLAEEILRTEDE